MRCGSSRPRPEETPLPMFDLRSRLPEVRPGEWPPVVVSFLYFFLLMMSYYTLKPVRTSLFVSHARLEDLPWMHLIVLPSALVGVALYDGLMGILSRRVVVPASSLFFAANLVIFRLTFAPDQSPEQLDWMAKVYYVWVSISNVFMVTVFWSTVNHAFDAGSAKRLYGLVGAGGVTGAFVGSLSTGLLAGRFATPTLLLVAGLLMVPCAFLAYWLVVRGEARQAAGDPGKNPGLEASKSASGSLESGRSGWSILASSRYILALFALMAMAKMTGAILDYQFNHVLKSAGMSPDENTRYMSWFFGGVNLVGLFAQLFLVAPLSTRFGPLPGLSTVPVFSSFAALLVLAGAGLPLFGPVAMVGQGFMYSLYQASRELLFVPTDADTKFRAKAIIDTFGFRFGTAVASLLMLALRGRPEQQSVLAAVVLVLCALSLGLTLYLARRHRELEAQNGRK